MNVILLDQAPLYATPQDAGVVRTKFWLNKPENRTEISFRMEKQVVLVNEDFKYRSAYEARIANRYSSAQIAVFDVWSLVCRALR
jgi:hypothetical protein